MTDEGHSVVRLFWTERGGVRFTKHGLEFDASVPMVAAKRAQGEPAGT